MLKGKVIIADSVEQTRKYIKDIMTKKGYKVFETTDGSGTIRMCRKIYPELVIIDVNLWGMDAFQVGKIIEEDNLSTVLFMTNNPDLSFINNIKTMKVFAYIIKPIIKDRILQTIEFSMVNADRINQLKTKVDKLETKLRERKVIDRAKGILMDINDLTEEDAYKSIRKESMDRCEKIEKTAKRIIDKHSKG